MKEFKQETRDAIVDTWLTGVALLSLALWVLVVVHVGMSIW